MDESQLRWAMSNRRRAGRTKRMGELLDALPMKRWVREAKRNGAVVEVLKDQLGEEVLHRVSIGGIRRGVLTLEVADASEAYLMQLNHSLPLLQAIQAAEPGAGIVDVRIREQRGLQRPEESGGR